MRSDPPELKGKLGAMLTDTTVDAVTVNGPEGALPAWDAIDWQACEEGVRRLRQRIFKAAQEQDWPKVRNLQKLMLRSRSNTLVSVRQVTQRNAGRKTAGIDGEVALTSRARGEVAVRVHRSASSWTPAAVRRVYIPKASNRAKLRPLGIPVITDRCHQARVRNALEPEWEARFEPRSYGFRPGRGCHDAIEAIYAVCKGPGSKRVWVLDADLAAAFGKIDHSRLLEALGSFPARDMIKGWLKAGVFEAGKGFAPTGEGTPQGGVISPCLLNVALHGLEGAAGVCYRTTGTHAGETEQGSPVLIRYADDVAVLCHSHRQAQQVKARLAEWLAPRGLSFNQDKTRIVHLTEGFDFLGFNVRRYPGGKLLIRPVLCLDGCLLPSAALPQPQPGLFTVPSPDSEPAGEEQHRCSFYVVEITIHLQTDLGFFYVTADRDEVRHVLEGEQPPAAAGEIGEDWWAWRYEYLEDGLTVCVWTVQEGLLAHGLDLAPYLAILNPGWAGDRESEDPDVPDDDRSPPRVAVDWDAISARLPALRPPLGRPLNDGFSTYGADPLDVLLVGPHPAPEIGTYLDSNLGEAAFSYGLNDL